MSLMTSDDDPSRLEWLTIIHDAMRGKLQCRMAMCGLLADAPAYFASVSRQDSLHGLNQCQGHRMVGSPKMLLAQQATWLLCPS